MTITHLYGRETDDQILYDSPASVYEAWADQFTDFTDARPTDLFEIIEWSTRPNRELLPTVENLIDELLERHVADELPDGYGYEQWEKAARDLPFRESLGFALDRLAFVVEYAVADKELRRLKVTWGKDGEPLLDGKLMYSVTP